MVKRERSSRRDNGGGVGMVGTIPAVGAKKATTPQNYCLNATKKCDNVPILKKDDLLPASTASEIVRCVSTCGMHGIVCGVFGGRASDYGDGRRHTKTPPPLVTLLTLCVVLKKVYRLILSKAPMTGDVELSLLVQKSVGDSMPPQAFLTV